MSAPSTCVIRPLTELDRDRYRQLWLHGVTDLPQYFRIAASDTGAGDLPTRGSADSFTLGAFIDDVLVGVVSLERDTMAKLNHKALVFRMFVSPVAAGTGIGRTLIERLITEVSAQTDLRQIQLTVLATNERAIRLYASLGFVEFAREPQAVRIGDDFVDELRMVRFIAR